jgi:hypothetical protein
MPAPSSGPRRARDSAPTLGVVVPATDRPPTLQRCLAALDNSTRKPDTLAVLAEPGGAGPAAARNLGAARCATDVLVFVDSDVEVHPEALALIERRFAADPGLAALFGAYDDDPAHPALTSRYRNLLHHHVHAESAGEAETFWAGLGAVRRERFEAVGGFDAALFPSASVEDIELGMRLRRGGARMVQTDFGRRGVPWARLLLREGGHSTALNLGWRRRASAATSVALIASLLARRPRLAAAALLANLVLDRDLYALRARRGGARLLAAGIVLHQLHQLAAVASVPAAVALEATEERP